jgi:hypothetical protein
MYSPTMSRTLSINKGSDDNLKVSTKWGFKPKARHIWQIADWDIPVVLAVEHVDQ